MSRTDLSERQWRQLAPHLPGDPHRGHAYVDHRRVLNGILWRLKTGALWHDVPARYGTWQRVLQLLQAKADIWPKRLGWGERRAGLSVYLDDPDVAIDTNHLERALRVIPMGCRNWLFAWTELGAKQIGIVQSLLATCRLHVS